MYYYQFFPEHPRNSFLIVKYHNNIDIIILLGNFHTQLCSLSAIGYFMKNSGFSQALNTVYGENPTKYIFEGKDYERAIMAHGIVSTSLKLILLEQIHSSKRNIIEEAKAEFLLEMEKNQGPFATSAFEVKAKALMELVEHHKKKLSCSKTNQLYFMYLDWYDSLINNLHAERLGLWESYIKSLKGMLPFMAAAARRNYTKCSRWFIEELENLDTDTKEVFNQGGFVLHRSTEPYGAVSPGLGCEQTLMASLKGKAGLTRGRPFSQLNHLTWVLSRPIVCKLHEKMRGMVGLTAIKIGQSSVKHVSASKVDKYWEDVTKVKHFFEERLVFDSQAITPCLRNIATGMVVPEKVNVYQAFDIGSHLIKSLEGCNPLEVKITKSEVAVQFPLKAQVSLSDKYKIVVTLLYFFKEHWHLVQSLEMKLA